MGVRRTHGRPLGTLGTGPLDWANPARVSSASQGTRAHDEDTTAADEVVGRLGAHFQVTGIRRGGWGEVYICTYDNGRSPRTHVALKSFAPRLYYDPVARRAFERECALSIRASLVPGIFPVLGLYYLEGRPFISMPAVPPGPNGEVNLRDRLAGSSLEFDDAFFLAWHIAWSLSLASHVVPGLVHADLKPENILMVDGLPWISDFGLARLTAQALEADAIAGGTPPYQAPEAEEDPHATLTVAADVYSFGVMLGEMLTGDIDLPTSASSANTEQMGGDERAKAELLSLAERCRSTTTSSRPADFGVIVDELERLASSLQLRRLKSARTSVTTTMTPWKSIAARRPSIASDLVHLDEYELAVDFTDEIDAVERNWEVWKFRGDAMASLGRSDEARASFARAQEASDVNGTATSTWEIKLSAASLSPFREAKRELEQLIAAAPNVRFKAMASMNLTYLYGNRWKVRRARGLLELVVAECPDLAEAWARLGYIYLVKANPQRAVAAFQRAIREQPWNGTYYAALGTGLMISMRLSDAASAFRHAVGCGSLDPQIFVDWLCCAYVLRRHDEVSWLRSAIGTNYRPSLAEEIMRRAQRELPLYFTGHNKRMMYLEAGVDHGLRPSLVYRAIAQSVIAVLAAVPHERLARRMLPDVTNRIAMQSLDALPSAVPSRRKRWPYRRRESSHG